MDIKEIGELVGLASEWLAACSAGGTIYGLFKYLDKKASGAANRAISTWIKGEHYKDVDLRAAVTSAFDHLYGSKLLSIRGLARCVILSLLSIFVVTILSRRFRDFFYSGADMEIPFVSALFLSDYISLFIVRRCLRMAATNLVVAIVIGMAAVTVSIPLALYLGMIAHLLIDVSLYYPTRLFDFLLFMTRALARGAYFYKYWIEVAGILIIPAITVHLWLPLFVLGATINYGLNFFFRAAGLATWFIKRGNSHPLEAIGMTASAVVFLAVLGWQGIEHFLI